MTKEQHVDYWKKSAEVDYDTIYALFKEKRFVHALFFCHLFLEKILKCAWVHSNLENSPPRTHNLIRLFSETKLNLDDVQTEFLRRMNDFQIEGRYPDYMFLINKMCTPDFTSEVLNDFEKIRECIQKQLP